MRKKRASPTRPRLQVHSCIFACWLPLAAIGSAWCVLKWCKDRRIRGLQDRRDSEFDAERSVDEMTGEATFQEFSSSSTAPVAGREAESDANGLWKKGSLQEELCMSHMEISTMDRGQTQIQWSFQTLQVSNTGFYTISFVDQLCYMQLSHLKSELVSWWKLKAATHEILVWYFLATFWSRALGHICLCICMYLCSCSFFTSQKPMIIYHIGSYRANGLTISNWNLKHAEATGLYFRKVSWQIDRSKLTRVVNFRNLPKRTCRVSLQGLIRPVFPAWKTVHSEQPNSSPEASANHWFIPPHL